jgi:hypothetical protein
VLGWWSPILSPSLSTDSSRSPLAEGHRNEVPPEVGFMVVQRDQQRYGNGLAAM